MTKLPKGALTQKGANGVEYVFFPTYFYDKNSTTKYKEKQKRLYIGKVVDGKFVPNTKYKSNPKLDRKSVNEPVAETRAPEKYSAVSYGTSRLLLDLAKLTDLREDLVNTYSEKDADDLMSLALFMLIEKNSTMSLYSSWVKGFYVPSPRNLTSQYTSRLLAKIGEDNDKMQRFFSLRSTRLHPDEFLSYDSTKIASTAENITDVRWAPSKAGNFQQEISLAILCGQESKLPLMFRILPGSMADISTVGDLVCRWDELGISKKATAVLDRGYTSEANLKTFCLNDVSFITCQKIGTKRVKECIEENMPGYWQSRYFLSDYGTHAQTFERQLDLPTGKQATIYIHVYRDDESERKSMRGLQMKLQKYEELWKTGKADKSHHLRDLFLPSDAVPGDGSMLERDHDAIDAELRYSGFYAFVSNKIKTAGEALAIYRGRDSVEKTFANLQSGLDMDTAGVHNDKTLRGKMLVCMIALTMLATLTHEMEKEQEIEGKRYPRLFKDYTVNELLMELRSIQRISVDGGRPRLTEITGTQLNIFTRLNLLNPITDVS